MDGNLSQDKEVCKFLVHSSVTIVGKCKMELFQARFSPQGDVLRESCLVDLVALFCGTFLSMEADLSSTKPLFSVL